PTRSLLFTFAVVSALLFSTLHYPPQALHSFPTRRSSDLGSTQASRLLCVTSQTVLEHSTSPPPVPSKCHQSSTGANHAKNATDIGRAKHTSSQKEATHDTDRLRHAGR